MGKARVVLLFALFMCAATAAAAADRANKSSTGGLFWASAKDESDLMAKAEADDSATKDEHDEFQGGFPSLDSMLQWAIGHSDPAKLKEAAQDVQHLSTNELVKRQLELKELMEKMKMPSDAELMQIAIADLNNSSISLEDRLRALNELLVLVEPIDNANDLNKLGGLVAVIRELNNSEPEIRTTSAWILGKASQNNPVVQKQILELGALKKLMTMVKSSFAEEAIKALYAVSAVIRNNLDGQELFYAESGVVMLQEIMSNSSIDVRLRRKSVSVVVDLAEYQIQNMNIAELPFFNNNLFLKSVVDLMELPDLDLQEKALTAMKSLLQLTTTEAAVLEDFCDLVGALERMRKQLEELMLEENEGDFARDMESLRREVELTFHRKLEM